MERLLLEIAPLVAKVVDGQDLTYDEALTVFKTIFLYDKKGYYFTALISAIHAKGETTHKLLGLIRAHQELGIKLNLKNLQSSIMDVSGSGGSGISTINISTISSFLIAALGIKVLKSSYWAVTGHTGSADIFEAFGISIRGLTKEKIQEMLLDIGIAPIFYSLISPKLKNRAHLSNLVFKENKLKIRTPFHLVTNLISPVQLDYRVYGVYDASYLEPIAQLLQALGFKRSLVLSGNRNFPEISNFGTTLIIEQNNDQFQKYTLSPERLGIKKRTVKEITTSSREENIKLFIQVLLGNAPRQFIDLAVINAGVSFYVAGKTKSISKGVKLAYQLIKDGVGFGILEKLIRKYGNINYLKDWVTE